MLKYLLTAVLFFFQTTTAILPVSAQTNCEPISFRQAPQVTTGEQPRGLVSADFDGDGNDDVAVAFANVAQGFSVLRKTGSQEFAQRIDILFPPSVTNPSSIDVADLNSDAKPDIVISSYLSNKVSVFPNVSSGPGNIAFGVRSDYSTRGPKTPSIILEDFDEDGAIDIVVGTENSPAYLSIFRNTGSGGEITFGVRQDFIMGNGNVNRLASGDFDGDSKKDIAVGSFVSGPVSIMRNTGSGSGVISFTRAIDLSTSGTPGDVIARDLNGDGRLDIAVNVSASPQRISIFANTSSGSGVISFGPRQDFGPLDGGGFLNAADLNGDGRPEIILVNFNLNSITVMRNENLPGGGFSFRPLPWLFGTGLDPRGPVFGDFNSDGKVDIMVANRGSNSVSLLLNLGSADAIDFLARKDYLAPSNKNISSISAGDFDGDGDKDLAASSVNSNYFSIYQNDGSGHFSTRFEFNPLISGISHVVTDALTAGDFDGDGRPDIAINGRWYDNLGNESLGVRVYKNLTITNGPIAFDLSGYVYQSSIWGNFLFARVFAKDFNGDGKLDLLATQSEISTETGVILRNTSVRSGDISFTNDGFLAFKPHQSILLEDADSDGRIDIIHPFNFTVRAQLNSSTKTGSVTFVQSEIPNPSSQFDLGMMVDIDGDQKKDLVGVGPNLEIVSNTSIPGMFSVGANVRYQTGEVRTGSSADFDGDGRIDLQMARSLGYVFAETYRNTSSPGAISLSQGTQLPYGGKGNVSPSKTNFIAEDFNLDGRVDIVSGTNSIYGLISVLLNAPCSVPTTASISGQVTTPSGQALRNATVTLTDSGGGRRQANTSSFGLYQFDNLLRGLDYTISIGSKRYRFAPRQIILIGNLSEIDFVGLE